MNQPDIIIVLVCLASVVWAGVVFRRRWRGAKPPPRDDMVEALDLAASIITDLEIWVHHKGRGYRCTYCGGIKHESDCRFDAAYMKANRQLQPYGRGAFVSTADEIRGDE